MKKCKISKLAIKNILFLHFNPKTHFDTFFWIRYVSFAEGKALAKEMSCLFFEVSCFEEESITDMFEEITRKCLFGICYQNLYGASPFARRERRALATTVGINIHDISKYIITKKRTKQKPGLFALDRSALMNIFSFL